MLTMQDYYVEELPTLLFSLHPAATEAIIASTKVIEYRRRFFTEPFQAFVYTTGKRGGVQLYLRCDAGLQLNVAQLAKMGTLLQPNAGSVTDYFAQTDHGIALPITAFTTFPTISLPQLRQRFTNFVTPRSYVFLDRPERQVQLQWLLQQTCAPLTNRDWVPKYQLLQPLLNEI